ncbi:oligosaccharide flippase family protein [uncultured Sunxiuqinia sp.]|uniref:oligosaccharide flippase family protein n=1 Tax=uncultured Sunxiuqinia sp. TaxID=1573825 RepID=UPI002637C79D|nr:oligosaccharide flippase family protein [uncultured Sunxiuqinia sp.]
MINILELKTRALNSRLVTDSFWALFGNIIAKGLALAAGIIVARFLGKDTFGEYGIIRNTLMSIAIFSTFGLGYTATKYVAEYKNSHPEFLRAILRYARNITLLVSGTMAVGLFFGAAYVADTVLEASHLSNPLRLVAVWIVFNAVTTTQIGVLAGFGDFKGMARVNTIVGITTFVLSLALTYFWQLNGALAALLLTQILNWWLNYRLVNRNLPTQENTVDMEKPLLREILNFSFPVALQEAFYSLTSWLTSLILIKLSTYGELGLYSAAMQWNAIILFIPGILRNVILSHLAEANNNEHRHSRVMKITLLFNFVMTFIPFLIVFLFSDFIASFYGETFNGLKEVISIAVFSTIFSSLSNVYAQAFMSKGENWMMFIIRLFRDLGVITIIYFLLKYNTSYNGAILLVFSHLTAGVFFLVIMSVIYNYKLKSKQN